jgi:hypothetical protein
MKLSRRLILQGAGTALALPMLDAMTPRVVRAAGTVPARLLIFHFPIGVNREGWKPSGSETMWTLGETQAPLLPFKQDINVITSVDDTAPKDNGGDHATGTAHLLTGAEARKNTRSFQVSFDQIIADKIGARSRFRSLELGTANCPGADGQAAFDPLMSRFTNWRGGTPLPQETNAQAAFDRLVVGIGASSNTIDAAALKRKRQGKSVLDAVTAQRSRLDGRVGAADKQKLDEYYTGIRELERSIGSSVTSTAAQCAPGTKPPASADIRERVKQMLDISVLAFKCDLTRVITFTYEHSISEITHPFLGVNNGYHLGVTHNNPGEPYKTVNKWIVSQFAYLLGEMKKASLLDSSLLYFTSELANGPEHSHKDYPIVLAGGGNGRMATGRLLDRKGETTGDVMMSLLQAFETGTTTFGAGYTKGITGLMQGV